MRGDTNGAVRVGDAIAAKFGKAYEFMDVDDPLASLKVNHELIQALSACDVLIAIIGARRIDLLKAKASSGVHE